MAQVYNIISIVGFSLAGIFFILAVVFWIRFNIPKIVGDLTGRTARKSISQMRSENERSGKKVYTPQSSAGSGSIRLKNLGDEKTASLSVEKGSKSDENEKTELLEQQAETELLTEGMETELLSQEMETELLMEAEDTTLLGGTDELLEESYVYDDETGLLDEGTMLLNEEGNVRDFRIIQSIVYIHTQEVI